MNVYEVIYGQRGLKLNSGQIVRAYVFFVYVCLCVCMYFFGSSFISILNIPLTNTKNYTYLRLKMPKM